MRPATKRDPTPIEYESRDRPGFRLAARAHCTFPDESVRCLYATGLSLGGTFILSMRPPHIGTRLRIQLFPLGLPSLSPIEASVIGLRIDPSNAEQSGFEALFTHVDDATLAQLAHAIERFTQIVTHSEPRRHVERRVMPRVATCLEAVVHLFDSPMPVRLLNLSLSGALLELNWGVRPAGLVPGVEVQLSIPLCAGSLPGAQSETRVITVSGLVVRLTGHGEPVGFAVQLFNVSEETELLLEQVMLEALAGPGNS